MSVCDRPSKVSSNVALPMDVSRALTAVASPTVSTHVSSATESDSSYECLSSTFVSAEGFVCEQTSEATSLVESDSQKTT